MAELLLLALALALFAAGLLWYSRRKLVRSGMPSGRLVYSDTGAWERCKRPLFSARYRLAGKPDYLLAEGQRMIPVEVKPRRQAARPYDSDVLQLAAYCLLVEEAYGSRPRYGLLKYRSGVYSVEYTDALRERVIATIEQMRGQFGRRSPRPNHDDARRCQACGYRTSCESTLD